MRKLHKLSLLFGALAASVLVVSTGSAATAECEVFDRSTKEVLPGVTLSWDSSFLCANAPDSGTYAIEVTVSNAAGGAEAVEINRLRLSHTTPKPRGRGPAATAQAHGLPILVAPGERDSFRVTGSYELVSTDEGDKANLHLRALGRGTQSGKKFQLGINGHLRRAGAVEANGRDNNGQNGQHTERPPPWAGPPAGIPAGRP